MFQNTQYKHLSFITMLYMTIKLITVVLIYKLISVGPITASASTIVMPIWFVMGDVIAEVYGYKAARKIIWGAIICQFIFAFVCWGLSAFPSPSSWNHQDAYDQVLGRLPRVALASFLAIVAGAFINAYAISKWKIMLRGKYFWLRSLGASAIGELIFTVIAYSTEFLGVTSYSTVLQLMTISYLTKLFLNPILIIPSVFIAAALKKSEGVDVYDLKTNFNPFSINADIKVSSVDDNFSKSAI